MKTSGHAVLFCELSRQTRFVLHEEHFLWPYIVHIFKIMSNPDPVWKIWSEPDPPSSQDQIPFLFAPIHGQLIIIMIWIRVKAPEYPRAPDQPNHRMIFFRHHVALGCWISQRGKPIQVRGTWLSYEKSSRSNSKGQPMQVRGTWLSREKLSRNNYKWQTNTSKGNLSPLEVTQWGN